MERNKSMNTKKTLILKIIVALVVLAGVGFAANIFFFGDRADKASAQKGVTPLQESYTFTARDSQGNLTNQVVDLKFTGAHMEQEVLVRGQKANARNGKGFFLLDIAVTNDTNNVLYLNPLDLVRLIDSEEIKLAPQVHQGMLEVRPQSSKTTNLGFVVVNDRKNFTIQVGELSAQKETFNVTLR